MSKSRLLNITFTEVLAASEIHSKTLSFAYWYGFRYDSSEITINKLGAQLKQLHSEMGRDAIVLLIGENLRDELNAFFVLQFPIVQEESVDKLLALRLSPKTRRILNTLTPRERQVLRERFSIVAPHDTDIGQDFKITAKRIREIEAKALRKLRLNKLAWQRFSKPVRQEELEQAYQDGMLRKEQLQDGVYYKGISRNTKIAKWSSKDNCFFYIDEIGCIENVCHPEDDNSYDLFIPISKTEPNDDEKLEDK